MLRDSKGAQRMELGGREGGVPVGSAIREVGRPEPVGSSRPS